MSTFEQLAKKLGAINFGRNTPHAGFFIDQPGLIKAPSAVLIHGVSGASLDGIFLAEKLYTKGYKIYLLDLPGHGMATPNNFTNFDQLGQWLAEFINLKSPDVVMAQSYASAVLYSADSQGLLPANLRKVYCCPTPSVSVKTRILEQAALVLPTAISGPIYHSYPAIWLRTKIMHKDGKKLSFSRMIDSEKSKTKTLNIRQSNEMAELLNTDSPYYKRDLKVSSNTYVFYGQKDNVVLAKNEREISKIFAGANIYKIPSVGHLLHFEACDVIVDTIAAKRA